MKRRRLQPDMIERFKEMRAAGKSCEHIAYVTGWSKTTVSKYAPKPKFNALAMMKPITGVRRPYA